MKLFAKATGQISVLDKVFQSYASSDFYSDLNFEEDKLRLQSIAQRMKEIKFRIAVIGEFSSGKSTFLNALLNQKLLPSAFKPTTNQVMRIENSDQHTVCPKDEPARTFSLTSENIVKLASETDKPLEIFTQVPKPMDSFVLYDTPGVNDPSALTEEVIFDLLGESDIIIFLMRAENALKQSELDFIKSLICKKDLEKFFFVVNFKDRLDDEDIIGVRAHVTHGLAKTMNFPRKEIEERVIFYSGKESLNAAITGNKNTLIWQEHTRMLDRFSHFARIKREDLEEAAIRAEVNAVVQQCCQKLDVVLDQLSGKDKVYAEQLEKINHELTAFKQEVHDASLQFRSDIREHIRQLNDGLSQDFDGIKADIFEQIQSKEDADLEHAEWIQKHLRREIEDKTEARMQTFWQGLEVVFQDFDKSISPELSNSLKKIKAFDPGFNMSPIISAAGMAGAGYMAVTSILPWIIFTGGIGGIAAIGAAFYVPGVLPAMGLAASKAATGLGSLFSGGAKALMGGYGMIKEPLESWEGSKKKMVYMRELETQINAMKQEAIAHLEQQIDPENLCIAFIEQKFPQKAELEQRIKHSGKDFSMDRTSLQSQIVDIQSFKNELCQGVKS
jgi:hypothetical protein